MTLRTIAGVLVTLMLAACTHVGQKAPAPVETPAPRALILISIDGFRADYLERGHTRVLSQLARDGVRAEAMRPSFPSVTFPNHYALVTGLRPDHNGIVNNYMEDAEIPGRVFKLSDREVAADPRWWNEGEPIWVTAENVGIRTATLFWPGSEVEIRGRRPSDWTPYDKNLPYADRVDRVLGWLDRKDATRPRFITLYFESVDSQGHSFGPDSAEVNTALTEVDKALGQLVDGLRARGADTATDIVIVSDHGMATTSDARVIDTDKIVAANDAKFAWLGRPFVGLEPLPGRTKRAEKALLGRHRNYDCWRKAEIPARHHFGTHRRIPSIFCLADTGWIFMSRSRPDTYPANGGAHGYDEDAAEMAGLFIAQGPSFRRGVTVPAFDNVHVYPLLARILNVPAAANDGDPAVLSGTLNEQTAAK